MTSRAHDDLEKYCLPKSFFAGIGAMPMDGGREENYFYLRSTGRYPAIPVVAEFANGFEAKFKTVRKQSDILTAWNKESDKVRHLNRDFPREYTGELFAGRWENTWVTYNPYNSLKSANVPLKYNTAESVDFDFDMLSAAVWKEFANSITFYINRYDPDGKKANNTITINGCASKPELNAMLRAEATATVKENWDATKGKYTVTLQGQNGPVELNISCHGTAADRLTDWTPAAMQVPGKPKIYHGPRQYEAECMDYKDLRELRKSGVKNGETRYDIRNYTGQGYVIFGSSSSGAVRQKASVTDAGRYSVKLRYRAENADISAYDIWVNGSKAASPVLVQSGADKGVWYVSSTAVTLNAGENTIEFKASSTPGCDLYLDNMVVEPVN